MTTSTHDADRLCWTALGVRIGFTSEQPGPGRGRSALRRPARPLPGAVLGALCDGTGRVVSPFVSTGRTASDGTDIIAGVTGSPVGLVGTGLNLTFTATHSRRDLCDLFGEV
jgi:hypothetical protein